MYELDCVDTSLGLSLSSNDLDDTSASSESDLQDIVDKEMDSDELLEDQNEDEDY